MRLAKTLIEGMDNSAHYHADHKLVFCLSSKNRQTLTFSDLALQSRNYAAALRRRGLRKGDLVGLLLSTRPEFILSLLGIVCAGGVPVPLPSFSGLQSLSGFAKRLAHIVEHSRTSYILTEQKFTGLLAQSLGEGFLTRQNVVTLDTLDTESLPLPEVSLHEDDLCLVQYTSGSTAAPKGVALTHRNVMAGLAAIVHGIKATADDVTCSWMPLFHDMGLIGLLSSIFCGSSHYLHTQRSFVGNPGGWLHEFSDCGATVYKGPSFSFIHMANVADDQLTGLDLSRWRVAFNGSEPIDPRVVERFTQRFEPYGFSPQAMLPVYGLAEVTLAASFSPLGLPPLIQWFDGEALAQGRAVKVSREMHSAKGLVAVGTAVLDHTLRIVDAAGIEVPEDIVGEVQIKGPAVMLGYYADPEATSEAIQRGWLRTGDLGFISNGLLFVTGRIKELVIVNGRKFYPQDVEQFVHKLPGVYQDHCVAFGQVDGYAEQMSVAIETELSDELEKTALINQVHALLADQLGLSNVDIFLLKRGGIPRTSSGKYQRALLRDILSGAEKQQLLSSL